MNKKGGASNNNIKNQKAKCKNVVSRLRRDIFLKDPSTPLSSGRDDGSFVGWIERYATKEKDGY